MKMSFTPPASIQKRAAPRIACRHIAFRHADIVIDKVQKLNTRFSTSISVEQAVPGMHHGLLVLFTFMWAGNFVLAEIALLELSPISFSVSRFLIAGLMMLGMLCYRGKKEAKQEGVPFKLFPKIAKEDWPRLMVVALLGAAIAPWLGIEGLHLTSGGRASLWLAVCPALSAGVGYLLRTETLGRSGVLGLVIAGIGTVGLAADGLGPNNSFWLGDLLLLIGICCAILELHLIKPLVSKYGPTSIVAARTSIGGAFYLLIASASLVQQDWVALSGLTWIAIIAGGAIGVGVGQWVKVRALESLGPTRVLLYGNLIPPVTLLLAWLALGTEPSTLEIMAGCFIILGALCIQIVDPHRPYAIDQRSAQ